MRNGYGPISIAVRHARSEEDDEWDRVVRTGEYRIVTLQSDREIPLTREGIRQVKACAPSLAHFLSSERPITIIPSSYLRAQQTAEILAFCLKRYVGNAVSVANPSALLGTRHLGRMRDLTLQGIKKKFPHEYQKLLAEGWNFRPPERGENMPDVRGRVHRLVDETIVPSKNDTILVTHTTPLVFVWEALTRCALPENKLMDIAGKAVIPNTYAMVFKRDDTTGSWRLIDQIQPRYILD